MLDKQKIGVGIITYNRPEGLKKLLNSLSQCDNINVVVVNDGERIDNLEKFNYHLINNENNLGVGKSKNKALEYLVEHTDCEHLFLIEDDVFRIAFFSYSPFWTLFRSYW
jgi:glycosyltransferase involved in cell wall biosynthesis